MTATAVRVDIEPNALPPDDIALIAQAAALEGWWTRFSTSHANAMIWRRHPPDDEYLLHDITSTRRGHGRAIMTALNHWADHHHLNGTLVCEPALVTYYQQFDWTVAAPFFDAVQMRRPAR